MENHNQNEIENSIATTLNGPIDTIHFFSRISEKKISQKRSPNIWFDLDRNFIFRILNYNLAR